DATPRERAEPSCPVSSTAPERHLRPRAVRDEKGTRSVAGMPVAPLVPFFVIAASGGRVYTDAQKMERAGPPVVFLGPIRLTTAAAWTAACVLAWIVAFPLYLVCRRHTAD